MGWPANPPVWGEAVDPGVTKEQEAEILERQSAALERSLEEIKRRLEEINTPSNEQS
jgi:hypothetical protein